MKKPTGRTGENDDRVHRCMAIEKKIMKKTHLGVLVGLSDSDTIPSENKGVGGDGLEGEDPIFLLLLLTTRLVLPMHLLLSVVLLVAFRHPQAMPARCWYSMTTW